MIILSLLLNYFFGWCSANWLNRFQYLILVGSPLVIVIGCMIFITIPRCCGGVYVNMLIQSNLFKRPPLYDQCWDRPCKFPYNRYCIRWWPVCLTRPTTTFFFVSQMIKKTCLKQPPLKNECQLWTAQSRQSQKSSLKICISPVTEKIETSNLGSR